MRGEYRKKVAPRNKTCALCSLDGVRCNAHQLLFMSARTVLTDPEQPTAGRIGLAVAAALILHLLALAAWGLWRPEEPPATSGVALVMVSASAPSGDPQTAAETVEAAEEEAPPEPAPDDMEAEPETAAEEEPLPVRAPEPAPVRPSAPQTPPLLRAPPEEPRTAAAPSPPARTARPGPAGATAGPPSPPALAAAGLADAREAYRREVIAALAREKRYPPRAMRRGQEGVVTLFLSIASDGAVNAHRVETGSGYRLLDSETLEMVQRIGRFPAPPEELRDGPVDFVLGIEFVIDG